ncbi:MAG: tripartite tricarboxylate transporter substrate binding protein [Betaproteobacteria bacterium]|nr:tripartite tricarboxylate transporter substrate binding protein [Betaproteobacteria bacterium]
MMFGNKQSQLVIEIRVIKNRLIEIRHARIVQVSLALLCGFLSSLVSAQAFPTRNVRIVVPFPAGGSIDAIARQLAQKYTEAFSRPVLVDNRPGAGTNIGAELVAKAAPDGHTWLMNSTSQAISAALYKNLGYDPEKDLAPVTPLMTNILVFVVASKVSAQSMKELMAQMRAQPGGLNFGTTGIGSGNHIAMEMFLQAAALKAVHVPYKGDAGLFPGLIANDVQIAFAPSQSAVAHMKAGRVRALAVASPRRSPALDVPTIAEASGLSNYEYSGWTSLFTTAGTPREFLLRINDEIAKILRSPDIQKNLEIWGVDHYQVGVDEFTARYRRDIEAFKRVVRDANIKVD